MRRAACLLGLLALTVPQVRADERDPAGRAFVEIVTEREQVFVGEPFELTLRFGIDREWFDEYAVKLFRKRMDLPVQVEAPGLDALPAVLPLDGAGERGDVRFALDGREAGGVRRAPEIRDGRRYDVVEHVRRYLPEGPGSHVLRATLRFGYATRFEEDFLGTRIAVDRQDVVLRSPASALRVVPLPVQGRPAAFAGAVGRFTVSASVAPATGSEDRLALTLVIEGWGNLAFVDPPPPAGLAGFHVYGLVDDHAATRRTIVYEITPLAGTRAVPAIPFAYFDPTPPAGYREVRSQAIGLERPAPPEAQADEVPPQPDFPWSWLFGAVGLVLAGLTWRRLRHARASRAARERSAVPWSAQLNAPGADPTAVLTDVLASWLGVAPAAVIGPNLADRLVAAGVGSDLATRTARTLERLVGARFGGQRPQSGERLHAEVAELLASLDLDLEANAL